MSRVIFCNRYFYPDHSATSQMLSDLAFYLAGKKYSVQVVTGRQRYDDPAAKLPPREKVEGVEIHRVWTSRFGRTRFLGRALDYLTFYVSATWTLLRMVRPGDVVVVKTDPPLMSIPAAWVTVRRGGVLVNWLQDLFPEVAIALKLRTLGGWWGLRLLRLRDSSLRSAVANVVIGELMRERLLTNGIPGERVRIVHNWADGMAIKPLSLEDNRFRRAWGLERKFVVGYSGNMGRAHEFGTVLGAAERLCERKDVCFVFLGGGAKRKYVEREAALRGLENIQFHPYQPRELLAESLSMVNVHLVSLQPELEGCIVPSKFYGIAAAGRPSIFIGNPHGEIARILHGADCGLSIASGNAAALAQSILDLSADPERCRVMGDNARQAFERFYDRNQAMERWDTLLSEITCDTGPR